MAHEHGLPRAISAHDPSASEADDLRRVVESQADVVAAQAQLIEQLSERLDRLEHERRPAVSTADGPPTPESGLDLATSRRHLMTKGAAAAATAVIGTAAVGLATATPAAALPGDFSGNPAVTGAALGTGETKGVLGTNASTGGGIGVLGRNTATTGSGFGIYGIISSPSGAGATGSATASQGKTYGVRGLNGSAEVGSAGVYGHGTNVTGFAVGVHGEADSANGTGVLAESHAGTGVRATSGRTQLLLGGTPAVPPGAGLARVEGEMVFDVGNDLWLCVISGTPGTWRKVAGPSTAGAFTVLPSTVRIYDSRPGTDPAGVTKGQIGNFATRTIDAKLGGAVPAGATAILVNLTIVNTGAPGYLGLYKNGITWPGNSTINWNQPNTLLANSAICALDDQARFAVKSNVGFTDFVIDTIGYYR